MRTTKTARDRFLVGFSGVLLAGVVSYGADAPVTLAVRPPVVFAGKDVGTTVRTPRDPRNRELPTITREDGERRIATRCFAVLGPDGSAEALRAPPRRTAAPNLVAGGAGC